MGEYLRKDYAYEILESFEELLDEKDITIPSDDRDCEDGEARLYGSEYYELEEKILWLLEQFEEEVRRDSVVYC